MCVPYPCSVFVDVYSVLCLFYLTPCVCICHLSHGPFAGVPSSQALPCFLITAPPPVLVLAVLGALGVWIPNQKMKKLFVFRSNHLGFFQTGSGAFLAARSARAFDATTHREKVPRHCVQAKRSLISICWKSRLFLDYSIATDKISRIELAESSLQICA